MCACKTGHMDAIQWLLDEVQADVNAHNVEQVSALSFDAVPSLLFLLVLGSWIFHLIAAYAVSLVDRDCISVILASLRLLISLTRVCPRRMDIRRCTMPLITVSLLPSMFCFGTVPISTRRIRYDDARLWLGGCCQWMSGLIANEKATVTGRPTQRPMFSGWILLFALSCLLLWFESKCEI